MPRADRTAPRRIRLTPERASMLIEAIQAHFAAEFDEPLSEFRARALLDFFVGELGPPVYNQGVRDAVQYLQAKLNDIEGDVHEIEPVR